MRRLLVLFVLLAGCAPTLPQQPERPFTAAERCDRAVLDKRHECARCWVWLGLAPYCYLFCGQAADALERECIRGAFATEGN